MSEYTQHTHKEDRGSVTGLGSLLPPWKFWGSNPRCKLDLAASSFTCVAILLA